MKAPLFKHFLASQFPKSEMRPTFQNPTKNPLTTTSQYINLSAFVDIINESHDEWLRDWPDETTATGRSATPASRCQFQLEPRMVREK
jgi:hypothetical protein